MDFIAVNMQKLRVASEYNFCILNYASMWILNPEMSAMVRTKQEKLAIPKNRRKFLPVGMSILQRQSEVD